MSRGLGQSKELENVVSWLCDFWKASVSLITFTLKVRRLVMDNTQGAYKRCFLDIAF